ncbi:Spy/CpxP family protein refolding chaperone [Nitrosomonas communis]|uniref:LTXXQ motif family protein n=1 Tax=Nitrosomonas communis TaxID=44574 RepID=A0A1I4W7P1_9PROT|nr:Spy/CpxP family protein refolding chaperone [Nitrosomonas communis]SFN09688.1 LTXXQ motif family protein [Nitrosomonas communis]
MISKRSIISIAIGSVFAITLSNATISMASNDSAIIQFEDKGFMLAQTHQHGQEKGSTQGGDGKYGEGQRGECRKYKHGQDKESGGMMKGGHDYAHMIISHADALKLSDEQLGKIIRLHLKNEQEHGQLKQKLRKNIKALKKESMKLDTSDAQLRNLGKELTAAFNEMIEFHIKERQAIQAILSDDQKNQLKTMKMDHNPHGGQHGGHGDH